MSNYRKNLGIPDSDDKLQSTVYLHIPITLYAKYAQMLNRDDKWVVDEVIKFIKSELKK